MKRVLFGICMALTLVAASTVTSPSFASPFNLLANPGFEANSGSYDGWFTFGSGPQISTAATDNIFRSGAAASKIFGEFTACPVPIFDVGGYGQAFTPIPGAVYKFTGYSFVSSADPMLGTDTCNSNRCIAKIVFFDAAVLGNEIESNEVIIGDGNTPVDQWIPFAVASAPAPAGALRVEVLILYLQPGCDQGSVFVDDTELCVVPAAPQPNILVNPSFDTDLTGWTTFGNVFHDPRVFAVRTSTGSAKLFGTFVPNSDSGMFQSFPATAGTWWRFNVFSMTTCVEDPISGVNDNKALAVITFRDALNNDIGSPSTVILDNTSPLGNWTRHTLIAQAPVGAVAAEPYILFVQPSGLGGAAWVDDLSFEQISDPTGIGDEKVPSAVTLHQNVPNPFNPETRIDFVLTQEEVVDITVYDVAGRRVTTLLQGQLGAGPHNVTWNGKSANGIPVATGVYRYVLKTSTEQISRSMVLMK